MADNVQANPGVGGAKFASDNIVEGPDVVAYPRNKLIHGDDGINDGDVSESNPLPIQIRRDTTGEEIGTASFPLRVDPTDTTPQTVQGTISLTTVGDGATELTLSALNTKIPASPATDRPLATSPVASRLSNGSSFYNATTPADTQPISAIGLPLPSGAATEATVAALLSVKRNYAINVQVDGGNPLITYVGKALPGELSSNASWQIMRIDSTTGTVVAWADGDDSFDNIYDNREALSYS